MANHREGCRTTKRSNLALKVTRSHPTRRCRVVWEGVFQAEGSNCSEMGRTMQSQRRQSRALRIDLHSKTIDQCFVL